MMNTGAHVLDPDRALHLLTTLGMASSVPVSRFPAAVHPTLIKLTELGLATCDPAGNFAITDAGRAAVITANRARRAAMGAVLFDAVFEAR